MAVGVEDLEFKSKQRLIPGHLLKLAEVPSRSNPTDKGYIPEPFGSFTSLPKRILKRLRIDGSRLDKPTSRLSR